MFRCIVAPLDGTAFGEQALPLAATVASCTGAVLHLTHVHVPMIAPAGLEAIGPAGAWNEVLRDQESGYLEGLAERLTSAFGASVRHEVFDGAVRDALERHARSCGADLLVMSTHGHTGFRRVWHHCVAEQIIRELPLPVLLVRPQDEESDPDLRTPRAVRHLLVTLDGSGDSPGVLDYAVALGRAFRARYTLLRVVPAARQGAQDESGRRVHDRETEEARRFLNGFAERLRAAGVEVQVEVREGEAAAPAIVQQVRRAASTSAPVDLIVMERHPHRGFGSSLTTHTTDAVVRDAGVPVLLVPTTLRSTTAAGAEAVALSR